MEGVMGAYNSLRKQSTASSINGQLENHCSAGHLATLCPQDSPILPPSLFSIPSVSSEFQEDHSTKCFSELSKYRSLPEAQGIVPILVQLKKVQVVLASTKPVTRWWS